MTGADVRSLQVYLNARGYAVAAAWPGSPGSETMTLDPATAAALIRFQQANGIAPADGILGPATRVIMYMREPVLQPSLSRSSAVLAPGMSGDEIARLQRFLAGKRAGKAADTLRAAGFSGFYSPLTRDAVREWQQAQGIVPVSGTFGPLTRAAAEKQGF